MALRVTEAQVRQIMDSTTMLDADILAYITTANTLVNSVLGTGDTDLLTEIEKWLAAHLIASTRERQAESEEAKGAKIKYTGFFSMGLKSTTYGQMVLTLDTTGKMATLSGRAAKITAIKSFDE